MNRFHRQITFAPFGEEGQRRLAQSRVLIVGCGALGSAVANILVRAGVATESAGLVGLIDPDTVSLDNLHRQFLFTEADAKRQRLKVEAARDALHQAVSTTAIQLFPVRLDESNTALLDGFDLFIDGTDNFVTRFLLNGESVRRRVPLISAGVAGTAGQMFVVRQPQTACIACLMPMKNDLNEKSDVDRLGVLSPIVQTISAIQASEAIKILTGHGEAVRPTLLTIDLWQNRLKEFCIEKNPNCLVCGH